MPTHDNLCPQCGKPTALVFGNPRKDGLCAQCAAKKRQEQKALENSSPKKVETMKADETIEANKAKPAKRNGNEKPVSKTATKPKKPTATTKSPAKSPAVPFDNSVAYAAKRFASHLLLSVIFIFIAAAISCGVCAILSLWGGGAFSDNRVLPCVVTSVLCFIFGAVAGAFLPTLSNVKGYVTKENQGKIKKVKPEPLSRFFWIYLAFSALCVVGFIFSRSPVYSGKWTIKLGDFDAAFIIPSLFLGAAIYFVTAKVFTLIPISASTCQKCFCYDCKLPTYKSDEKSWTETETETRDSYDSGTSVSFSDGSYATIGGGWSKESKSRAVHKQSWTQHLTCKWCGNQTNVQENDEQREKWSNWN